MLRIVNEREIVRWTLSWSRLNKIQKEYFYLICMFCSIPHCIRDSYYCKTEKYVYQDPTREAELEADTYYGIYCRELSHVIVGAG